MIKRRQLGLLAGVTLPATILLLALSSGSSGSQTTPQPQVYRQTTLSETYTVDRKYRSMMGPSSGQKVRLFSAEQPELLWIVGYEATMVGPDGSTPRAQDFMCHSNLDINRDAHRKLMGTNASFSSRLFTLSQGQLSIRFPPGFGIPILSSESLDLTTQVLNLNLEGQSVEVRHRVGIDFVRDVETDGNMTALFPIAGYGLNLLEGDSGHYGVEQPQAETHGPGCLVGDSASEHQYEDLHGRKFTGHWVVPPGRQVNRTLVTHLMKVPYDTTVHYIAVHLHPFAESLELRDLTTGEVLFKSQAKNFEDRIGLAHVDYLSSEEGVPVFADHEYEIVSVYDNTTSEPQDSMAVMYMYLRDNDFDPRQARAAGG